MHKLFLALLGIFGAAFPAVSFSAEPTQAGASDEALCAALSDGLKPSRLRPNTNAKVREVIEGIAPERVPARLVVCSGYNPYTAAAQKIENLTGIRDSGWVVAFDDQFFREAPEYVFRATMAHEIGHLVLNEACRNTKAVSQCEHQIDVFASTLVGKCAVVRSIEWFVKYSKRRSKPTYARHYQLLRALFGQERECGGKTTP
ncbi:MAG: hypothetical protein Q7S52_01395 [bacterium]|nr:hypothetical protein [bacterium]